MFEKVPFKKINLSTEFTPHTAYKNKIGSPKFNQENLQNSDFCLTGSLDYFNQPPITDFAQAHLYYVQNFSIFHYGNFSFTERQNFPSFLLLYTYGGSGSLAYRNKTYSLSEGDGVLIDCKEYHLYKTLDAPWDVAALHLNGSLLPAFFTLYIQNNQSVFHESMTGKLQYYLDKLMTIYSTPHLYRDWQASTCIDMMLNHLLLLSSHKTENTEVPQNIQYLMQYMEHNYAKHLTLDYLADFSNMDKYYLAKQFKKYTGFPPNDYLISLRINQAKLLLKTTSHPAVKIAHEVGIHDTNNFTKLFKKKTGMTPIQYRNSDSGVFYMD